MAKQSVPVLATGHVEVRADSVVLSDVAVMDPKIVEFFGEVAEEDRVRVVSQALRLGVICLERVGTQADVDFLRKEVESMLGQMTVTVSGFGDVVAKKIGTGDGQLLQPVAQLVDASMKVVKDKLNEVKKTLEDEVDPTKKTSVLGKAVKTVEDLINPKNKDSVQAKLEEAVAQATGKDGQLAKTVKETVAAAVKPLADEVNRLAKQISGEEAVEEALEQTTKKGTPWEEEIVDELSAWAPSTGAQVDHVGPDNQPGDILLTIPSISAADHEETVVIECRDRTNPLGRKAIGDQMEAAMEHREARGGVYLSKTSAGLAKEIGDWSEGVCHAGPWVATTADQLHLAVRWVRCLLRLETIQQTKPDVDVAGAQGQIARVRAALKKVQNINIKAGEIRTTADDVSSVANELREEVRGALLDLEDALRLKKAAE